MEGEVARDVTFDNRNVGPPFRAVKLFSRSVGATNGKEL